MSLIVKHTRKQYEIADEGTVNARLSEIRELGEVQTGFGAKEKLLFVWETEQLDNQRKPIKVFQRFTRSIHPKAALYKAVRAITGEEPGDEFDLSELIHASAQLVIQHNDGDDGITYANVAAIVRPKTTEEEASKRRVQPVVDTVHSRQSHDAITDMDVSF